MTDATFTVGGHSYVAEKLSAIDAMDVARKWHGTLLWATSSEKKDFGAKDFAQAFLASTGSVPKFENDFALFTCLGRVKRKVGGDQGMAPIITSEGVLAYQDIEMPEMLEIVWHVLRQNKLVGPGSFFDTAASASQALPKR